MISDTALFSLGSAVVAICVSWGMDKSNRETDRKDINNLYKFKDSHERESYKWREELSIRIGKVETITEVTRTQYVEILRRIDELKKEISEFRAQNSN